MRVTVGRIGSDRSEEIRIARLDDAPVVRTDWSAIAAWRDHARAAQWLAGALSRDAGADRQSHRSQREPRRTPRNCRPTSPIPDDEGLVRLQSFQGGAELPQALRAEFVSVVLKEAGLTVTVDRSSLIEILVTGHLDKDHGARDDWQIERALVVVLRFIWSLRDLDYAMAYIFLAGCTRQSRGQGESRKDSRFAVAMARMFIVEEEFPSPIVATACPSRRIANSVARKRARTTHVVSAKNGRWFASVCISPSTQCCAILTCRSSRRERWRRAGGYRSSLQRPMLPGAGAR